METVGRRQNDRRVLRPHPVGSVVVPDGGTAVADFLPAGWRGVVTAGQQARRPVPAGIEVGGG